MRSNLGLELRCSNHSGVPVYFEDITGKRRHPHVDVSEAQRIREIGEVAYNREAFREALEWMRDHPGEFAELTLKRMVGFWFVRGWPYYKEFLTWLITLLAFYGLVQTFQHHPLAAWLFGVSWLTFPIVYYVNYLWSRCRYPIDWSILFLTVYALFSIWCRPTAFSRAGRRLLRWSTPASTTTGS